MPLKLALAARETVAGRRLGALEGRGVPRPPLQMHRCPEGPAHIHIVMANCPPQSPLDQPNTKLAKPVSRPPAFWIDDRARPQRSDLRKRKALVEVADRGGYCGHVRSIIV